MNHVKILRAKINVTLGTALYEFNKSVNENVFLESLARPSTESPATRGNLREMSSAAIGVSTISSLVSSGSMPSGSVNPVTSNPPALKCSHIAALKLEKLKRDQIKKEKVEPVEKELVKVLVVLIARVE